MLTYRTVQNVPQNRVVSGEEGATGERGGFQLPETVHSPAARCQTLS